MKKGNGFTLVEILIVVVILGILAAIVIPQFSTASEDAKLSALMSSLWTIRSQIQLYKLQYDGAMPTAGGLTFTVAMTSYTVIGGTLAVTQAPGTGVYGPYLQKIPANPFDDVATVLATADAPDLTNGWHFNTTTGAFSANDSAAHAAL